MEIKFRNDKKKSIRAEEYKLEANETNQRKTRKDINFTKDRFKTNSYHRNCKPQNSLKNLKNKEKYEDFKSEPIKKLSSPDIKFDEKTILLSEVIDEVLKEIYSSETKNTSNLKYLKNKIKYIIDKKKNLPEIILETLINKLSSIMENEKENVIEKHCSKQLIFILKNNNKNFVIKGMKKNKKQINLVEDLEDKNFFVNFWNKYKKEIDNVINELNQLYSILLNSVKDISYVFEYPFKLIEEDRKNTKISIESFIKDKFFDVICNDELIKTLIHEIKKCQKNKNQNETNNTRDIDFEKNNSQEIINIDVCHNNNHSTCDDNDNVTVNSDDSIDGNKENFSPQKNKFNLENIDEAKNCKDLNDLVDYINKDNSEKVKNYSQKKKTQQNKKKAKSKKNINNTDFLKQEKLLEEDKIITEFKIKLENDSSNAKEKQKVKPLFSKRFLSYLSSHLDKN